MLAHIRFYFAYVVMLTFIYVLSNKQDEIFLQDENMPEVKTTLPQNNGRKARQDHNA